jgi:hypothetical protein
MMRWSLWLVICGYLLVRLRRRCTSRWRAALLGGRVLILLAPASNVIELDKLICECGDYRSDHEYGSGYCRVCLWDPTVPMTRCRAFRLAPR